MSKSASDIEQEVERARGNVENTVDALKEKMTVGQMFEQFSRSLSQSGGSELVANFGSQVRDNPLPLALIGAGIAWLAFGSGPSSRGPYRGPTGNGHPAAPYSPVPYDEGDHRRSRGVMGTMGDMAGTVGHGVAAAGGAVGSAASTVASGVRTAGETVGGAAAAIGSGVVAAAETVGSAAAALASGVRAAGETVGSAASAMASGARTAGETVGSAASAMASGARMAGSAMASGASTVGSTATTAGSTLYGAAGTARDTMESTMGSAMHTMSAAAHDVRDTADYYGRRARRGFVQLLEEEPFLIGALGVAVGAAIGAMLPSTATEDQYIGEYSDRVWEEGKEFAGQAMEQAMDVAETAYSGAKAEADRQGLTAAADVGSISDKIERVAKAGVDAARDEASKKVEKTS